MKEKKVLLITYYWPPAGGAGVQRWLKMSKFLSQKCKLTVFFPRNATYPVYDTSFKEEIPENITHIQAPIWEPYSWAEKFTAKNKQYQKGQIEPKDRRSLFSQISLWIRANLFIPDARMLWIYKAIKSIRQQINLQEYDAIISTGPPHSCHLIAKKLKDKHPYLQWLTDFRDPWTNIDYFSQLPLTKWALNQHKKLEKSVLQQADIVTTVSPSWASELEQISGRKVNIVYNGFDEEDFKNIAKKKSEKKFTITYLGSLNSDRNPSNLWQILEELCQDKNIKNRLALQLIGTIAPEIKKEIETLKHLEKNTNFIPYLEHKEAIKYMVNSDLLLLLINDTSNQQGIIPGKFFEYLASGNNILCIGNKTSDIHQIIQETYAGKLLGRQDTQSIKEYLISEFKISQENHLALYEQKKIEKFSRRSAAKKIITLLELNV